MDRVLTVVLAGGGGQRLFPLTQERAKPAVPFGGKYRIVDFTLSNCINSGIRRIYILTQYRSGSLNQHIQEGWGISHSGLGDFIYTIPAQQKIGTDWYRGTADAIRQNLDLVKKNSVDHILVLSGDHVYKMDYKQMLDQHLKTDAGLTIAAVMVRKDEAAGKLGVIETDEAGAVIGFEEKPEEPKTLKNNPASAMASMGVYLFRTDTLIDALKKPIDDFGHQLIPELMNRHAKVFVYNYTTQNRIEDYVTEVKDGRRQVLLSEKTSDSSYWKDVGSIESYYEASMDLVGIDPDFNLYGIKWPFRTFQRKLPPSKIVFGGSAHEAIISEGCIISGGGLRHSIISPGVIVERGAFVEDSILFDDVIVEPLVRIRRAIIDKSVVIRNGATIGYEPEKDKARGFTISETGITVVPKGIIVEPN